MILMAPLDDASWPGPFTAPDDRSFSRFTASWQHTISDLYSEIAAVAGKHGADQAVLEVPFAAGQLTNARRSVRSDARTPRHPGVAVSFVLRDGTPLRLASDRYKGNGAGGYLVGWKANVRALALTLEALRSVERYGAVRSAEQYRGFTALGAGDVEELPRLVVLARLLWEEAGAGVPPGGWKPDGPHLTVTDVHRLYRMAAHLHHPDVGGDPDRFLAITEARRELLDNGGWLG